MEDKFAIEVNKLRNLKQYQSASEEVLRRAAFQNVLEDRIDIGALFPDEAEKRAGKRLVKKYLEDFTPETVSDVNTLRSIIYLEILDFRLQNELNSQKEGINLKVVETVHKNQTQILALKDSLGLSRLKQDASLTSVAQKIATIRKQFKVWLENNQASRNGTCPYCGQVFLLKIRMEHWEMQKHPFFKDRILYNKPLVDLYLQGIISKEKLAEILESSPDYIDWIIARVHKNVINETKLEEVKEDDVRID
jgi:DNA-directed RNA polymerase subunit RPC12/RpoP